MFFNSTDDPETLAYVDTCAWYTNPLHYMSMTSMSSLPKLYVNKMATQVT